ncbi:MAG TPA: hypothetical protein RMG95_24175 [Polyangiaceae bacterium LLY-WYZ-15_(1-7)]|nr:hypothetical protein [Polyangiaceae bacterium LLY-WYZ-15_(1-7)]
MDLVPSPVAGRLLELRARKADGELDLGGRHLRLREGVVVAVTPAADDGSLVDFLVLLRPA